MFKCTMQCAMIVLKDAILFIETTLFFLPFLLPLKLNVLNTFDKVTTLLIIANDLC